jgi:hypothetical protein
MPRAGYVGDELETSTDWITTGARQHDSFLMERQYPPYPKWFGTAFQQLACASALTPVLLQAQTAATWQERGAALCQAFELLAHMHNALGITEMLSEKVQPFYERPFFVIGAGRFVDALLAQVTDPAVQAVARLGLVGSVDLFSDNTDLRSQLSWRERLRRLLDPADEPEG